MQVMGKLKNKIGEIAKGRRAHTDIAHGDSEERCRSVVFAFCSFNRKKQPPSFSKHSGALLN
jgi:hypothetical protein